MFDANITPMSESSPLIGSLYVAKTKTTDGKMTVRRRTMGFLYRQGLILLPQSIDRTRDIDTCGVQRTTDGKMTNNQTKVGSFFPTQ